MFRTILVPLDGSEVAASTLEQVVALARSHGARLLLLTVGLSLPTWLTRASDIQCTLTFQAEAYLERVRTYMEAHGLEVNTMVCLGEPAATILDVAARQQVDLIVINSRDGGGSPLPFLGSVAAKVASAAAVPVLVLDASADARETK
jgi:nucleotide-binding universal stress UspA family protein